jgi:hypothetical protein
MLLIYYFLGTEFKTSACPITGVMHHIEIQHGKEGMKSAQFNAEVGATTGLLNTVAKEDKELKHGIQGDAWFVSVRTANEVGHKGIFQVKQYHSLFPKEFIENSLKDAPGGVHILMEGITKDEVRLVAIGYRYSRKTVLFFVLTENAGKTEAGTPYEMKFMDSYGNVCVRGVDRPDIISKFLNPPTLLILTINFGRIHRSWKLSGEQEIHFFVWVQCSLELM